MATVGNSITFRQDGTGSKGTGRIIDKDTTGAEDILTVMQDYYNTVVKIADSAMYTERTPAEISRR